jgi:hypothetical protein
MAASSDRIQAPDLPEELERRQIDDGDVELSGALVEQGAARTIIAGWSVSTSAKATSAIFG